MTEKQKMFCEEYLIDLNATRAAIRAGYSPKRASGQGCALLKHPEISKHIKSLLQERQKRVSLTADRVVFELAEIAFADLGAENNSGFTLKITDKLKALELLGKHLGIFTDKGFIDPESKFDNPFKDLTTEELRKLVNYEASGDSS